MSLARSLLSLWLIPPRQRKVIFVYHDVSEPTAPGYSKGYSTPPAVFAEQLHYLKNYFDFVGLDKIVDPESTGPMASVTFDDGFFSVRTAQATLQQMGIAFAVFVNKQAVMENFLDYGREYYTPPKTSAKIYLDLEDLKFLVQSGATLGNHTARHSNLADLSVQKLEEEISENVSFMQSALGQKPKHFAIPFGKKRHIHSQTLSLAKRYGHDFIYSTNPDYLNLNQAPLARIPLRAEGPREINFLLNRPLFKRPDL